MAKLFIGMDLSITGTGVMFLDEDLRIRRYELIETSAKEHDLIRLPGIAERVQEQVRGAIAEGFRTDEMYVLIENYSYGSQNSHLTRLGELNGYIKRVLLDYTIPWKRIWVCSPNTAKKYVTGKGRGAKSQVMLQAYKKWEVDFADDNLCDAYVLARLMRHVIIEHEPLKYELECLRAVAKMNQELWENDDAPWFVYGRGDKRRKVRTKEDPEKARVTQKTKARKAKTETKGKFNIR